VSVGLVFGNLTKLCSVGGDTVKVRWLQRCISADERFSSFPRLPWRGAQHRKTPQFRPASTNAHSPWPLT